MEAGTGDRAVGTVISSPVTGIGKGGPTAERRREGPIAGTGRGYMVRGGLAAEKEG